jgi:hypothetical protein
MKILYFETGSILALGDITEQNNVYSVKNDPYDIPEYSLEKFGESEVLEDLIIDLPADFEKWKYDFILGKFTLAQIPII